MKFKLRSKSITDSEYIGLPEEDSISLNASEIELGLWAIYEDDIYITDNYSRGNHYDWFLSIGLPTKYPIFDKIHRGFFSINNRVLTVTIGHGDDDIVIDKSSRLLDRIGHKEKYDSFNFYHGAKRIAKLSFNIKKEADVKEVVDKIYDWIKKKLKDETSTEIELKKDLEPKVEKELEKEDGVEESKGVIKRVVDTVIEKLKDDGSVSIIDSKPAPKDTEEELEEIEDGEEGDLLSNILKCAKNYKMLWISYRDRKGQLSERYIEPWEIKEGKEKYLYAHYPNFTRRHKSDIGTRRFIMAAVLKSKPSNKNYTNPNRWEMKINI